MNTLVLVVVLSTQELISIAIGQAAVEADVFLILREAPKGDKELQLLWDGWHHLLHHLEGDVCRHRACTHLCEGVHTPIWANSGGLISCPISYYRCPATRNHESYLHRTLIKLELALNTCGNQISVIMYMR